MSWCTYRLVYCLESPIHIGWRKTGNLMRTRHFVPGRTWWGAVTSHLTHWSLRTAGGASVYEDIATLYKEIGYFVQNNLIFGYFFPALDPDSPLVPCWDTDTKVLYYGTNDQLIANEFEQCFITSIASTAIDAQHNTSAEGQLHEVEFIVPHTRLGPVFLVGHLLVCEEVEIKCEDKEIKVCNLPLLSEVLTGIRLGGERRYGFGCLKLQDVRRCEDIFGHRLINQDSKWPVVELNNQLSIPAHLKVGKFNICGEMEPLVGREWDQERGPGRHHSSATICCMPGARTDELDQVEIRPMGIWVNTLWDSSN